MSSLFLNELLLEHAERALQIQRPNGSFDPGHNGPYFDDETPVRNTSHWLFAFACIYERFGYERFREAGLRAIEYLLSVESRPMDKAFWCRTNREKDFANGLMGQAWAFEGLIKAYEVFGIKEALDLVRKIYQDHPWDSNKKVWRTVNVDGSYGYDKTFNHQLWFAAITSRIGGSEGRERALDFLIHHIDDLILYSDGVIYHNTPVYKQNIMTSRIINSAVSRLKFLITGRRKYHKSAGYHAFNLYALGMLKTEFPCHFVWKSRTIDKVKNAVTSKRYSAAQIDNKFSHPYNPTGFEVAYFLECFEENHDSEIEVWLNTQLATLMNIEYLVQRNSVDLKTFNARVYEAFRLSKNYNISSLG